MKLAALSIVGLSTIATSVFASAPTKVKLPISKILAVETGFDDNDAVDIAVYGMLPDTCHKIDRGTAKIDHRKRKITVSVTSIVRSGEACLEILTPFLEVIPVGTLKAGKYEIRAAGDATKTASLEVKNHTSDNRDDYIYAPVDTVELERAPQGLTADTHDSLQLKGTYPYMLTGCMRVDDVKITTIRHEIMVVQPSVKTLEDKDCHPSEVGPYNRFSVSVAIPESIGEQGLVHVRTLNGKALNKFVDFSQH
jgi:hypothetical protein